MTKVGGRGRLGGVCGLNDVTIVFGRFPSPSPLPRGFPAMSLAPVAPFNVSTNHDSEAKCEDQTPFFIPRRAMVNISLCLRKMSDGGDRFLIQLR